VLFRSKLDSSGKIEWDKTIGGKGTDGARSVREVEKNKYVIGGYSSSGKSGDKNSVDRKSVV